MTARRRTPRDAMTEFDIVELEELFHRLWPLPPEQRAALLDEVCSGRPSLKQRLLRLLAMATSYESGTCGSSTASAPAASPASIGAAPAFERGTMVGGYRLERWLGRGGMGEVWEARNPSNGMRAAIKLVLREVYGDGHGAAIAHEFHQLVAKRHDHIVRVHDAGVHEIDGDPIPFVVMEYLPGARPLTVHADAERLSVERRVELFLDVCDAVAHVHGAGQVHLDIKPDNLLVDASGRVFLTDFGIARPVLGFYVDRIGGTVGFMGPEQLFGDVDRIDKRADVWALGAVLFELLTGQDAHGVGDAAPMSKHLAAVRRLPRRLVDAAPRLADDAPELIRPLERIVQTCMDPARERRFADASELATAIRAALHPGGLREVAREVRRKQPRLARALWVGGIVAAASLVAAFVTMPATVWLRLPLRWYWDLLPAPRSSLQHAQQLTNVTLVGFDAATPKALAGTEAPPFDPAIGWKAFRPLHAALIGKLVAADVRAIAFDIEFATDGPHDALLANAIRAAHADRVPVVVGIGKWDLEAGAPKLAAALRADGPQWGGLATGELEDNDARQRISIPLLLERSTEDPMPSFALATYAAVTTQFTRHAYARDGVTVSATRAITSAERRHYPDGAPAVRVEATQVATIDRVANDETGVRPGDVESLYVFDLPQEDAFARSTIRYEDVWLHPDDVGKRLRGRVALIADFEPGHDGSRGYLVHAAAIESLILGLGTAVASLWSFALTALGAALGAVTAARLRRWLPRPAARVRRIALAGLAIGAGTVVASGALLSIAWVTRRMDGALLNALPGIFAAALAGFLAVRLAVVSRIEGSHA